MTIPSAAFIFKNCVNHWSALWWSGSAGIDRFEMPWWKECWRMNTAQLLWCWRQPPQEGRTRMMTLIWKIRPPQERSNISLSKSWTNEFACVLRIGLRTHVWCDSRGLWPPCVKCLHLHFFVGLVLIKIPVQLETLHESLLLISYYVLEDQRKFQKKILQIWPWRFSNMLHWASQDTRANT